MALSSRSKGKVDSNGIVKIQQVLSYDYVGDDSEQKVLCIKDYYFSNGKLSKKRGSFYGTITDDSMSLIVCGVGGMVPFNSEYFMLFEDYIDKKIDDLLQ